MAISYVTLMNILPWRSPQALTCLRDDTVFDGFVQLSYLRVIARSDSDVAISYVTSTNISPERLPHQSTDWFAMTYYLDIFLNFNCFSQFGKSAGFTAGDKHLTFGDLVQHKILSARV